VLNNKENESLLVQRNLRGERVKNLDELLGGSVGETQARCHKESTHVLYEYFRTYFAGSGAEASRMEALQRIREYGGVVNMISATIQGSDMEQRAPLVSDRKTDGRCQSRVVDPQAHARVRRGLCRSAKWMEWHC